MKSPEPKRYHIGAIVIGVAVLAGCPSTDHNGYFLSESPAGDIGLYLADSGCKTPPDCLPTQQFGGVLSRYASDEPLPQAAYLLADSVYGADGSFSTTATNEHDSTDTATVTGQSVDLDNDMIADQVTATVTFSDGTQNVTMPQVGKINYDHYKCWDNIDNAVCYAAIKVDDCTVTPLGNQSFASHADLLFKLATADLIGPLDTVGFGLHTVLPDGSSEGGGSYAPIDQTVDQGVWALTSSHTGTTAGTVTMDVSHFDGPAVGTSDQFTYNVDRFSSTPQIGSNPAECAIP